MTDHRFIERTKYNPGGTKQQPRTYYGGSCSCGWESKGFRVEPLAALDDFAAHAVEELRKESAVEAP